MAAGFRFVQMYVLVERTLEKYVKYIAKKLITSSVLILFAVVLL